MRLKPVPLATVAEPWPIGNLRIQPTRQKRQVADRVNEGVSFALTLRSRWQRPVHRPLPRHDMLDGVLTSRDSLAAQALLPGAPPSAVIFDGLEYHAKSPAPQSPICGQDQ